MTEEEMQVVVGNILTNIGKATTSDTLFKDVCALVSMAIISRSITASDEPVDFAFIAKASYALAEAMAEERKKRQ